MSHHRAAYALSALKLSITISAGRRSRISSTSLASTIGKSATVEDCAQVFVDDTCPDSGLVEEAERLAVAEDLLEWLGHRREVERRTLGRGVVKEILLRKDRLARTGTPHDEVDPIQKEAATKKAVEPGGAAREPVAH